MAVPERNGPSPIMGKDCAHWEGRCPTNLGMDQLCASQTRAPRICRPFHSRKVHGARLALQKGIDHLEGAEVLRTTGVWQQLMGLKDARIAEGVLAFFGARPDKVRPRILRSRLFFSRLVIGSRPCWTSVQTFPANSAVDGQ